MKKLRDLKILLRRVAKRGVSAYLQNVIIFIWPQTFIHCVKDFLHQAYWLLMIIKKKKKINNNPTLIILIPCQRPHLAKEAPLQN